jgi:CheY-like chemotaxis protein
VELPVGGSIVSQKKIQPLFVSSIPKERNHDAPPVDVIQLPSPSRTGLFAMLAAQPKTSTSSDRSLFAPISAAGSKVTKSSPVPSFNLVQPSLSSNKATQQTPKRPRNIRVLYAEDNIVNQKVLGRVLTKLGITDLYIVENGLKAVEILATKEYDIIFLDMQMTVMDGLEATRLIKERGGGDDIAPKMVLCTANAMGDFHLQVEQAGGDGFVSKPFNLKTIDSILQEYE